MNADFSKSNVQQIQAVAHNTTSASVVTTQPAYAISEDHIKKIQKRICRQRQKIQEQFRLEEEQNRNFERSLTWRQAEAYDIAKLDTSD